MPLRFRKIDDLKRGDHSFLNAEDECYYLHEYTPRAGFKYSPTNDLISNFKKNVNRRGLPEWYWKEWAVNKIAAELLEAWGDTISKWTLVPVPPSKSKENPEYDDRLVWVLRGISQTVPCDIRELIIQTRDMEADHSSASRVSLDELLRSYVIDGSLLSPIPQRIAIVDDMLTAGKHFRACKAVLLEHLPGVQIIGVFVARDERP